MSVAQLVGQVVTGVIGDRVDKRHLAAGCMLVQSAVLLVMATASGFGTLVAAAVVHGLAWGLRGPAMTAMRTDYFGLTSFGTIMGWSMWFVSLGLVVGPLLVTVVEAGPGGYPVALVLLAVRPRSGWSPSSRCAARVRGPARCSAPSTAGRSPGTRAGNLAAMSEQVAVRRRRRALLLAAVVLGLFIGLVGMHHLSIGPLSIGPAEATHMSGSAAPADPMGPDRPDPGHDNAVAHLCLAILTAVAVLVVSAVSWSRPGPTSPPRRFGATRLWTAPRAPPPTAPARLALLCVLRT